MSSNGNIQQQVYARAREGIFRTNEGLDTIAKSAGLDNNFIKKTLHPFCVYQTPQELRQFGEQELSKYPESMTVFHADSGELIVGRSLFAGTDFTGQRDSIIAHNYVIPKGRVEEFIHNPNGIFRVNGFLEQYDAQSSGKSLPELDIIPHSSESHPIGNQAILDRLKIDETIFKQLLWSVMMSISSNKKVFVALDVNISEGSLYAKRLVEILYQCLPYGLRRKFGFTTYNQEPLGKKFINVMFVEKGSIRLGDRTIDKEYIFDFPNERFLNVDLPAIDYFVELAYVNREQPERLWAFYDFAEDALRDMDPAIQLSWSSYYELCALFLIEQGDRSIYESAKEATVSSIMKYLTSDNVSSKQRLDELFWQLVKEETSRLRAGQIPSLPYLETMINYYRVGGVRQALVGSIMTFLHYGWNHGEDTSYVSKAFQTMQKHSELFGAITVTMVKNEAFNRVLQAYTLERLDKVTSVKVLQDDMSFWLKHSPDIMSIRYFQEQFIRVAKKLLEESLNRIADGRNLHDYIDKLYKSQKQLQNFCDELQLEAELIILSHVELGTLSEEQLEGLTYMLDTPSNHLTQELGPQDREKLHVLKMTWQLIYQGRQAGRADTYDIICKLQKQDLDEVQKLLKKFVQPNVKPDNFEKVLWAFYQGDERGEASFAFYPMLNFVHIATNGSDSIYKFLNWSTGHMYFLDSRGQLSDRYKIAIRDYFDRTNEGALKSRMVWSMLKDNRNDSFIKLLKEIKLKQANPLWRFMVKKWLYILMSMAVAVLAVLLTFGVIIAIKKLFPPRNERPAVTTPAKQEPSKESGTPPAADKNSQDSAKLSDTTNPATNKSVP